MTGHAKSSSSSPRDEVPLIGFVRNLFRREGWQARALAKELYPHAKDILGKKLRICVPQAYLKEENIRWLIVKLSRALGENIRVSSSEQFLVFYLDDGVGESAEAVFVSIESK